MRLLIAALVALLVVLAIAADYCAQDDDCRVRGGVLVEAPFRMGWQCVKGAP